MSKRTVDVVYADDIRIEKTDQISLIGVYQSVINVPAFPFIFPKLCFWFRARTSPDDLFQALTFAIDDDSGNRLATVDIPPESFVGQEQAMSHFNWQGIEDRFIEVGIQYAISPLVCNGPMLLKPVLVTERETIKFNALRIQLATETNQMVQQQFALPQR